MTSNEDYPSTSSTPSRETTPTHNSAPFARHSNGSSRCAYLSILTSAGLFSLAGCSSGDDTTSGQVEEITLQPAGEWTATTLTDIQTGEAFSFDDFAGTTVLIEFFAVWCPTCTSQQEEIQALHAEQDDVVSISLNTDPNEDAAKVQEHLDRNGFDWRYAIAPPDLTDAFVDQYGKLVAAPPQAPVLLVCPDQQAGMLRKGVKPAGELAASASNAC